MRTESTKKQESTFRTVSSLGLRIPGLSELLSIHYAIQKWFDTLPDLWAVSPAEPVLAQKHPRLSWGFSTRFTTHAWMNFSLWINLIFQPRYSSHLWLLFPNLFRTCLTNPTYSYPLIRQFCCTDPRAHHSSLFESPFFPARWWSSDFTTPCSSSSSPPDSLGLATPRIASLQAWARQDPNTGPDKMSESENAKEKVRWNVRLVKYHTNFQEYLSKYVSDRMPDKLPQRMSEHLQHYII